MENKIPWLLQSSADPKKIAMTVKGLLVLIVPIVMFYTGIHEVELNAIIDMMAQVVELGTVLVGSALTLYGLIRKIWLRIKEVL